MYCDDLEIPIPYKGLIPYSQTDKLFFFGREKEQQTVIQNLRASRLTVVYGASGVGKSSLMRAGVAYHLHRAALENQETNGKPGWGVIVFPPLKGELQDTLSWQDPLTGIKKQLEAAIVSLFPGELAGVIKQQFAEAIASLSKNKEQASLSDILKAGSEIVRPEDESGRLFIILDQFEEYFELLEEGINNSFADEFSKAVNDPKLDVHFLIAIREDALAKLDYFKGRIFRNFLDNRLTIKHLNRQSAQDAIEKPIIEYNRQEIILDNLCKFKLTVLYGDSSAGKSTILRDAIVHYLNQEAEKNLPNSGQTKLAVTLFNSWHQNQPLTDVLKQKIAADIKNLGNFQPPPPNLSLLNTLQAWTKLIDPDIKANIYIILDQFEEYLLHHYSKSPTDTFANELLEIIKNTDANFHFLICIHDTKITTFQQSIFSCCERYLHIYSDGIEIEDNTEETGIIYKSVSIDKPDLITAVLDDIDIKSKPASSSETQSEARIETPYLQMVMLRLWKQEIIGKSASRKLQKQTYINLGRAKQIVRDHLDQKLADLKHALNIEPNTSDRLFYYLVTPSGDKLALKANDLLYYYNTEPNQTEKLEMSKIQKWLNKLSEGESRILRPLAANRYEIFLDVLADAISQRLQFQRKIKEIEQMAAEALQKFESSELEALLTAMRAGQELEKNRQQGLLSHNFQSPQLTTALQHILDNIREQNQFQLHGGQIFGMTFSPDGQKIATASLDRSAYLWDLQGKPLVEFKGHKDWVWGVSFSSDGQYLATASADCTACLWNLQGQKLIEFKGHQDSVWKTSFSHDGKYLATASFDRTARLWDLQGKQLIEFVGHQDWVLSLSFSPDGKYLATSSTDGTTRLWDLQGNLLKVFPVVNIGSVYSVNFSPDGKYLVTAAADGLVNLWDLQANLLKVFKGHQSWVWSANFSPSGEHIASVSWDATTRLWDLEGNQLALLKGPKTSVGSVSFSPNGQYLITGSWDGTACLWNLYNQPLIEFKDHERSILSISFSPNGQYLATASSDGTAYLWNLQGQPLVKFEGGKHEILSISFSPNGEYLATGSSDGTACLWDLKGKPLTIFKRHNNWVWSVNFSPDGQYLATGSSDGTACLWNLQGKSLVEFKNDQGCVWSVSFSPDGQYLATGLSDNTACLWDMRGNLLTVFKGHQSWVWNVSFSQDGKHLVTTSWDTTARLWDLEGNQLALFKGHSSLVWNASFSPDGQQIATASSDGTARVWNLQGYQLAVFKGHTGVYNISFSPDGQQLAIALADGSAKLWHIEDINQLLTRGCNWLKDYFVTHPEAREYLTVCHTY